MKKLLACASAYALIVSSSIAVVPTVASAAPTEGKAVVAYCKFINEIIPEISVGECVGSYHGSRDVVAFCKYLKDIGVLDALEANLGNCVSALN